MPKLFCRRAGHRRQKWPLIMQQPGGRAAQKPAVSFTDLEDVYVKPPSRSVSRSCSDVVPPPKMQPWKKKLLAGGLCDSVSMN